VVTAQEEKAEISMSREFLLQVIRTHGKIPARVIAAYLEHSLDQLDAQRNDPPALGRH
jgi:polyhydroxyalkanoate synthesis regulator protein